jgi:hypothetical protein
MSFLKPAELSPTPTLSIEHDEEKLTMSSEASSERTTTIPSQASDTDGHIEEHSHHDDVLRDIIIGFAEGLTVPFALTAGLSSYVLSILHPADPL